MLSIKNVSFAYDHSDENLAKILESSLIFFQFPLKIAFLIRIPLECSYLVFSWFLLIRQHISFRRELSVMHSLRMCCKILYQNLVVHPKCMLGGSTKFHAFHGPHSPHPPTHPPQKWEFWILAFLDSTSKVGHELAPPPPRNGNLGF